MFTGIIENQGTVAKKEERGGQIRFKFRLRKKVKNFKVGDSIAVDGTCLTAVRAAPLSFEADVVRETLQATTLGQLKLGSCVNLERSLRMGDELGGHFVTGHIDGRGKIVKIKKNRRNTTLFIEASKDIIARQAPKGSVAIDGISLTVQKVHGSIFEIAVIPHTLKVTTLGSKRTGSEVNIEIDIAARYLAAFFGKRKAGPVSSKAILKALLNQRF